MPSSLRLMMYAGLLCAPALSALAAPPACLDPDTRARARDLGIAPGVLKPGPLNAITDVDGVRVGHVTLVQGKSIRTGATAILAHGGNIFQDRVPAGMFVANGHGKAAGSTQVMELGEIETPIVLTNTLAVSRGIDAVVGWTLAQPGNEEVRSVNAVVGETNDSSLNDIRGRALTSDTIMQAIKTAKTGPVEEGAVGAGTGMVAFEWKGGIGTSSRKMPDDLGGYTIGVLVQSNYGGVFNVDGRRVGEELGQFYLQEYVDRRNADGSIMMIVATDAPLSDRNLTRLAKRAAVGLSRTGASFTNGSGDYVIAFSTAESVRRTAARRAGLTAYAEVSNDNVSPLFQAVAEATEEAILNSMFMAKTMTSYNVISKKDVRIEQFPLDRLGTKIPPCTK